MIDDSKNNSRLETDVDVIKKFSIFSLHAPLFLISSDIRFEAEAVELVHVRIVLFNID